MAILRGWQRLFFVSAFTLFTFYTILLYGRPSWLPAPPRPWDGDVATSKPGSNGKTKPAYGGKQGMSGSKSGWNSGSKTPAKVPGTTTGGTTGGTTSGGTTDSTTDGTIGGTTDDTSNDTAGTPADVPAETGASSGGGHHPIDRLIEEGHTEFKALLGKRSLTLEQAASRYRERRGRHPPPGFDAWWEYAEKTEAVVVEDFFDHIYRDMAPFWALNPREMRRQTHTQPQLIRVRNGKASFITDNPNRPQWIQTWTEFVKEFSEHLPDLDMVLNVMDETRLLVPWEKISEYVQEEQAGRRIQRPLDTITTYSGLADVDNNPEVESSPYEHSWITNDANGFWNHLAAACPPGSPARDVSALETFNLPIEYPKTPNPAYTRDGYISNVTASRDPCLQPYLRGMHGTFIESVSMSTSHELLPMFAGCKLPQNNEILIPGAMYLTEDPFYSGGKTHGAPWEDKTNGMIWRGTASGGRSKVDNWWHFHRHRWVQMTNGSTVRAVENGIAAAGPTFQLPHEAAAAYPDLVSHHPSGSLGDWVSTFADVGFVDLECFPLQHYENNTKILTCDYTSPHMAVLPGLPMQAQYDYKYLPDVDGNSYSARWRSFLRSTSMPLKATIYAEWHDDRLIPWVHFVPFDSSYMDLYAVMDYFLANSNDNSIPGGHDAAAKRIAEESREWAEAVLRREDMHLYVWRLLLEYARVVDDNRDVLAYVGDLLE